MKEEGILIVISGPSGTGKGTICKELLQRYPNLAYSVSATTRVPRAGEEHGTHYWFTEKGEFERMIAQGELLEWAEVYGNYYGTPLQRVRDMLYNGKDVLLEIDPQGAMQVQQKFPEGVFIYIMPPSLAELADRIHRRGTDSEESIARRMDAAVAEIGYAVHYNYVVINDVVNVATGKIAAIVQAEKCSVMRNQTILSEIIENKGDITI